MNKIAILFAILAVASATVQTNTPSSAFAIAPGKVFTNVTDAAFTSLVGDCEFNGGFDNTTNYIWCQTVGATATVPYTFQRRAINASSPGTVNSTLDTKLATTHMASATAEITCAGPGYFGIASDAVASSVYNLYFSYAAVNASSFTKVALTANTATGLFAVPQVCMYNNGIFYIVYKSYVSANNSLNSVYVQAVNVTSGAVFYNSTGGVKLFDYTAQSLSYITITGLVGNNKTNSATSGLLLYTNSYSATPASVLSTYNVLPFTLATGAAGSLQTLATGATSTPTQTSATFTFTETNYPTTSTSTTVYTETTYVPSTSSTGTTTVATSTSTILTLDTTISPVGTTGSFTTLYGTTTYGDSTVVTYDLFTTSTIQTTTALITSTLFRTDTSFTSTSSAVNAVLTSTISTTYQLSAFGSLSTYGVLLVQTVQTNSAQISANDKQYTYTTSVFYNGSTTASASTNFTNPSGYHLIGASGYSTSDGFALVEVMASNTGGSSAYYLDQYFYNGTNKVTATSLGTFGSGLQTFPDATGSIWGGYTTDDTINGVNTLAAGYAGEILYVAGASTLSSIFAALIVMIAALFAF